VSREKIRSVPAAVGYASPIWGVLADRYGRKFMVVRAAGSAAILVGLMGVALLVREETRFTEQPTTPRPRVLAGMREVLTAPALLAMIGAIFVVQFATTQVYPILPRFVQLLEGRAGHAALATGLILAGAGVAGALSSTTLGWVSDRIGHKAILVTAALIAACLSVPQFFVQSTWQLGLLRVADGFALGAMLPASSAMLGSLVPSGQRGAAYGLASSATSLGIALGPLTTALVVALSGIRTVFLVAAVLLGAIAVWVASLVRLSEPGVIEGPIASEQTARPTAVPSVDGRMPLAGRLEQGSGPALRWEGPHGTTED
jgi:MFS family permease